MNFRRVLTALALIAVFTALASAQVTPATQVTCAISAASAPNVRADGVTERVGDLKLTCTGGLAPINGSPADRATVVVDYGVALTSRLDGAGPGSEILLVIDEPGTLSAAAATSLGISGYGPNAASPVGVCSTTSQATLVAVNLACPSFAVQSGSGYWVTDSAAVLTSNAINAYQGAIGTGTNNTKVTFTNVPVVPPITSGVQRVFRIVNARVNPNGTTGAVTATVASASVTSGASTLAATGSAQVATSAVSLSTAVSATAVSSCITTALTPAAGQSKADVALLKFTESFGTAFKSRVLALTNATPNLSYEAGAGLTSITGSYTIGTSSVVNNSESGYVTPVGVITGGLADSGTRLKAIFRNLDPKATYYVSLNPVADFGNVASPAFIAAPPTATIGGTSTATWAQLLATQGVGAETAAFVPAGIAGTANSNVPVGLLTVGTSTAAGAAIGVAIGTAEVAWEVTNANPASAETLNFAVYAVYPASAPPATSPATAANVQLGYAPTNGATAPGVTTTWIPRFAAPGAAVSFFSVLPCQTSLLFPFVTNIPGFETGMAISNTSKDPFNTVPSAGGTCALSFYGTNAPAAAVTVGPLAGGETWANTLGGLSLVNFTGYSVGVCNFLYGHGFAYINDNVQKSAMGYLALVLDTQASSVPRGSFLLGESIGQ